MKLSKTVFICAPLIFRVGKVTASVYLKLYEEKLPNKLVILTRASRKYLSGLAQGNRLMERTVQINVQR